MIRSLESDRCHYSDRYNLVTGNIATAGDYNNKKVALKNCAPFKKCITGINDTIIDEVERINNTYVQFDWI